MTMLAAAVAGVAALIGVVAGLPAVAQAAGQVGYVRLAHLSPDTPAVDVYLSKDGDASFTPQRINGVAYGTMSAYIALPVGSYTVAMRPSGAPESDPPVKTTSVDVDPNGAYTVAGVGLYANLGLTVFTDDLAPPATGKAKVRVIQASKNANLLDVALANGTPIASDVQFAETTPYYLVNPGSWTLELTPTGSTKSSTVTAHLAVGNVYTLIVLDRDTGLGAQLRRDAGGGPVPDGGVAAGEGGAAGDRTDRLMSPLILVGTGAALVLAVLALGLRTLANQAKSVDLQTQLRALGDAIDEHAAQLAERHRTPR